MHWYTNCCNCQTTPARLSSAGSSDGGISSASSSSVRSVTERRIASTRQPNAFESRATSFTKGALFVYMGGAEIDLMDAELAAEARLSVKVVMGGVSIVVPPSWRVEVRSDVKMGEVVNKTDPDDPADGPLLVIDVKVVMGGVEVKDGEVA